MFQILGFLPHTLGTWNSLLHHGPVLTVAGMWNVHYLLAKRSLWLALILTVKAQKLRCGSYIIQSLLARPHPILEYWFESLCSGTD